MHPFSFYTYNVLSLWVVYTDLGPTAVRVDPTQAPVCRGRGPAPVLASLEAAAVVRHPLPLPQTSPAPLTGNPL